MATFRDSSDVSGDDAIQANSFGGLNTTANPLNIPYEDSPDCLNVDIAVSGNVEKRKGTLLVKELSLPTGFGMYTIQSPLGNKIIVTKQGTSLVIYTYESAGLVTLMTKSNVFTSAVASLTPTFCEMTAEGGDTKLLILTGYNVPIILTIRDYSGTQGSAATSVDFTDPYSLASTAPYTCFSAFRWDSAQTVRTVVAHTGVSIPAGGTFRLTGLSAPGYNALTYVSFITWQWVAEAKHWKGYRLWDRTSRYGAAVADRHVAIPETIRDELWANSNYTGFWPMRVYRTNAVNPSSQYSININPTANTEYFWTDGNAAWTAGEYSTAVNSPLYATFGLYTLGGITVSSQSAAPVYFSRMRKLNFKGGSGQAGQYLSCYSTDDWFYWQTVNQALDDATNRSATTNGFCLFSETNNTLLANNTSVGYSTTLLYGQNYTGAQSMGSDYIWVNKEVNTYVGSGASNAPSFFPNFLVDGRYIPWYGIGDYANYDKGYFPRLAVLINDRLILTAFPNDPGLVLFSEIADSLSPGQFFSHFQIDPFTESYGAFDLTTNLQRNDEIRSMIEFRGNVFIFSERTTLRLTAQSDGSYALSTVAKTGIANHRALAISQNRVTVVNQAGVFELQQVEGLSDSYAMVELSTKIRGFWDTADYTDRYYSDWDETRNKLYVTYDKYLLCMDGLTGAWSKYLFANSKAVEEVHYTIDSLGNGLTLILIPYDPALGTNRAICKLDHYTYLDFCTTPTDAYPLQYTEQTTTDGVQLYKHNLTAFLCEDVQDLTVTINGTAKTYGTDWFKIGADAIYLATNPGGSKTLRVTEKAASPASARYIQTDGTLEYGLAYLCYFATPNISTGKLGQYKRSLFINMLFSNRISNGQWMGGDTTNLGASLATMEGYPKVPINCQVAVRLNHAKRGETVYDLYNFYDLWYDLSRFDMTSTADDVDHVLIRTGVQGVGYDVQAYVWSWDQTAFSLDGYQYDVKRKGKKYVSDGR